MSILSLLILAALTLTDPTGDAFGDGELVAPTSPIYANPAIFDIHELHVDRIGGEGTLRPAEVRLTLAGVALDPSMASGFSGAVFDVYIDTGEGGIEHTLPGPGMLMPPNSGWEYALRIGPDAAFAVAHDGLVPDADSTDTDADAGADAGADLVAAVMLPDGRMLARTPVTVVIDGNTLRVMLPWNLPSQYYAYAVSGVHDSFSASAWRQLAAAPSPWAFSGGNQRVPVVDLIADSQAEQVRALQDGVLPRVGGTSGGGWPWLLVMAAGVGLAVYGLLQRRRAPAAATTVAGSTRERLRTGLPPLPVPAVEGLRGVVASTPMLGASLDRAIDRAEPEESALLGDEDADEVVLATSSGLGASLVEEDEDQTPIPPTPMLGTSLDEGEPDQEASASSTPILGTSLDEGEQEQASASPTPELGVSLEEGYAEQPSDHPGTGTSLEPPKPDPFERLVRDSEDDAKSVTANDLDTVDHSQLWGRKPKKLEES